VGLERFKAAQSSPHAGFEAALAEIRSGQKRGHWIWYVFPQLAGLGSSEPARAFAIANQQEAAAFLYDAELRGRLLTITAAVLEQLKRGVPLRVLMGSEIDVLKLVSALTLFGQVATRLHETERLEACHSVGVVANDVLAMAASQGYPPCAFTLRRLQEMEYPETS
jgi:uncharacterized protein (DUF1810 family)